MTEKAIIATVILLVLAYHSKAQTAMIKWNNLKNEAVLSYNMDCAGQLYSGSKYTKWMVELINNQSKTVKCEAVMINDDKREVSEAVEVTIKAGERKKVIFLRANLGCEEAARLNFNNFLYRKNKRGS